MGWLSLLICALPLYLLFNTGHRLLWIVALVNAIANLWSYGVMHNYAVGSSAQRIKNVRRNLALEGRLDADKQRNIDRLKLTGNPDVVPNWLSTINMISFIIGFAFVVYGAWLLF